MKRVLVTGATGFIGRACVPKLLDADFEVHGVTRTAAVAIDERVVWHRCDLLAEDHVSRVIAQVRPTHCLHTAWVTTPGEYWSSSENFGWSAASQRLARVFAEAGGTGLVMVGSCAEYMQGSEVCDEMSRSLNPHTLYGRCKHGLHMMLESFAAQSALRFAWGRVFYPYGRHQEESRVIPSVARSLLNNQRVVCRTPRQVCDWIHVDDVAEALVTLVTSKAQGTHNVSTGVGHAVGDVVSRIGRLLDREHLIDFGESISRSTDPISAWVGEPRRLREELGWRPRFDLDRGLQQTVSRLQTAEAART